MGTEGADFRVIAGRYRLEARIGRGGMGVVWRASDELLGRRVAVKELLADDSLPDDDTRRRQDRTLREARAVAQLRHPHIVVVHDVVEQDERPYLVMELIEGASLADRIARDGPVDAAEAARIGIALLSAVHTAHEAGVLHRDIKPANVLIESGTGRVVLTDFGIAQVAGATTLTETGSFVGSPEYTAPERMSGVRTGPESDLWSLGALLCTALSGESPFRRDSIGGILHAVVAAEIRPPDEAEPLLPVVRGLLERDPDRRLGAADAERMLRTYLETGRTPEVPGTPGPAGGTRPHRIGGGRTPRPAPAGSRTGSRTTGAAMPYSPTQADVPYGAPQPSAGTVTSADPPARTTTTRGVLVAALLVAALAGAGVTAALLLHRGGDGGGGSPGGTATSPATGSDTGTGTGTGSGSGSGSGAGSGSGRSPASSPAAGSAGPSATGPSAGAHTAPSGYRTARDPAGFSLAVPQAFTRSPQGERVFYLSPGETFRLGIRVSEPQPGGPQGMMERSAAEGPDTNPGYRDGRVTGTTRAGHPAALWEFTWDGFSAAEGPRHTYDLCWEDSGRLYDVWVSAPVGKVREAREYFDVAVDTFAPAT
ncbi:serine/threonine-protein kinase [Streptomyces broussonetiae]|uniref:non-specific serine/threonine protein kinase n=1 Tax=Streptomyces broussonetiae TaxID=2686304 RepID=A0A6I6N0Y4_9ACTN|nr:serine/threonine-protein kinase [Streptomyces broussonetiae]QHA06353.1 protein kinase [Streptomyces broussonetiae]